MSEASVMIAIGNVLLEALVDHGNGVDTVVTAHPHPLYGGSMDNNVVAAIRKAVHDCEWGTLRFNFRGVGGSSGHHQGPSRDGEDLLAVCEYARKNGGRKIHFAGYSYGAWVGLKAMNVGFRPETAILVSPPLDFLDFKDLAPPQCPCLITVGDQDDFCAVASLKNWVADALESQWPPLVQILPQCDHFYRDRERPLAITVESFLRKIKQT
jgi:uncharacterized protein